ncbi:MAG: hypothetical protein WBD97_11925 [Pseudolabrys sp.]
MRLILITIIPGPKDAAAQAAIDFSQIDEDESVLLGRGTQRGGSPPKTIADDGEGHVIILAILEESNTEAKVYWKSKDRGTPQTIILSGPGVQAFQTIGEFKLEALGDENHIVRYGYTLFRLKK